MNFLRAALIMAALACVLLLCASCHTTEQVRKGYSVHPINSPAAWESNPYGVRFQN